MITPEETKILPVNQIIYECNIILVENYTKIKKIFKNETDYIKMQ